MDEARLRKYAELLVRTGGNVQKGQPVVIAGAVDDAPFVRLVQEYAFDAGASDVFVNWNDDESTRMWFLRAEDGVFDEAPEWFAQRYDYFDAKGAVYLAVRSPNPDMLAGVEPNRIKRNTIASNKSTKEHSSRLMSSALRWSLAAHPSAAWAKKVFPNLSEAEALEKLWAYVLKGARADGNDPAADWAAHKNNFAKHVNYLNDKNFSSLRFQNSLGTDLTIGLAKNHIWCGGGGVAKDGIPFFPNLPTEEIFTMPDRCAAEGRVVASMPLNYKGSLIEDFEIAFWDGRAVSWKAGANEKVLADIIETDEGSRRLGEVALVAESSPISQMKTLFYNTLFDENASCHFALGKAYPTNLRESGGMTEDELIAAGCNDSITHVDFMFGTPDLKITGTNREGETVFFDNGEFII